MKKIFEKNEITFAVILIVIYVVVSSAMKRVSDSIGVEWLAEMFFGIVLSAVILIFIKMNGLKDYLGLCKSKVESSKMLFYIPLWVIPTMPLVFGLNKDLDAVGVIIHTVYMMTVGFLEEIILRGFLFRGIEKENLKRAVIISSVTFGIGHIINLLNGYNVMEQITQIIYALFVGFMLAMLLVRTGSLITCIIFHALNNCMAVFASGKVLTEAVGSETTANFIALGIRLALAAGYTAYILKKHKENKLNAR